MRWEPWLLYADPRVLWFVHAEVFGLDPEGVVDVAIHDGGGVQPGVQSLMLVGLLRAERR